MSWSLSAPSILDDWSKGSSMWIAMFKNNVVQIEIQQVLLNREGSPAFTKKG